MWGVGFQWGSMEQDGPAGGATPGDVSLDIVELDGSYILGPGVSIQAALRYGQFENDAAQTPDNNDNDFFEFLLGSSFSF
jgi:hypothetical protein